MEEFSELFGLSFPCLPSGLIWASRASLTSFFLNFQASILSFSSTASAGSGIFGVNTFASWAPFVVARSLTGSASLSPLLALAGLGFVSTDFDSASAFAVLGLVGLDSVPPGLDSTSSGLDSVSVLVLAGLASASPVLVLADTAISSTESLVVGSDTGFSLLDSISLFEGLAVTSDSSFADSDSSFAVGCFGDSPATFIGAERTRLMGPEASAAFIGAERTRLMGLEVIAVATRGLEGVSVAGVGGVGGVSEVGVGTCKIFSGVNNITFCG